MRAAQLLGQVRSLGVHHGTLCGVTVPIEKLEEFSTANDSTAVEARRDIERALVLLDERSRALLQSMRLNGVSICRVCATPGHLPVGRENRLHSSLRRLATRPRGGSEADE